MIQETTAEFTIPPQYTTDRRSPVRWIISHSLRQWWILLIALIGAFGNAALMAVGQVQVGEAFNVVSAPVFDPNALFRIFLIIVAAGVARGILQFSRNFGFEFCAQRIERNVRRELYASLLSKSMTFHNLQPVGDTMARATNDVREVNFLYSPGLNMVVGSLTFLVFPILYAPRYHPSLLLVPCIFVVLYFVTLKIYMRGLAPITEEVRESFGGLNIRLNESLDGIETVKGSAQETGEIDLFKRNVIRYKEAVIAQGRKEAKFLPMLLYAVALGAGLLHVLLLYRQGLVDIGGVVGYFGLLLMLDFPTFASLWAYSRISLGLAGAKRILDVMNRENNLDQNTSGYAQPLRGEVEFRNVTFRYESGESVLELSLIHI